MTTWWRPCSWGHMQTQRDTCTHPVVAALQSEADRFFFFFFVFSLHTPQFFSSESLRDCENINLHIYMFVPSHNKGDMHHIYLRNRHCLGGGKWLCCAGCHRPCLATSSPPLTLIMKEFIGPKKPPFITAHLKHISLKAFVLTPCLLIHQ